MSSLETSNMRSDVPGSVNMIQYAFDKFNGIAGARQEEATIKAIKEVPILGRTIREGRDAFHKAKDEIEKSKNSRTYVPTGAEIARDVQEGLYRGKLDGTER